MTQLTTKPITFFKPDPNQPRKHFDEAALRALGESLKVRQNDPVQARPDGTIIDGERRWRAAMLAGLEQLEAIITDAALSDSQINLVRLTSFFHREDLTAFEKWSACRQILELNPGWLAKDLAGHLHVDPSMVTRLLSPSKCTPAWLAALEQRKVGISDIYAASKLPESEQAELLALKLSGASRDAIETAGRKKRTADVPAVKVNRVKCLLPSGVQIVICGTSVSLDESIEALTEGGVHGLPPGRRNKAPCGCFSAKIPLLLRPVHHPLDRGDEATTGAGGMLIYPLLDMMRFELIHRQRRFNRLAK